MSANSWANWFKSHKDNDFTNSNMSGLFMLFNSDLTPEICFDNARSEQGTVFAARSPDDEVLFIHHISSIGGTRIQQEEKQFFISGLDFETFPVKAQRARLFDMGTYSVPRPFWSRVSSAPNAATLRTLMTSGEGNTPDLTGGEENEIIPAASTFRNVYFFPFWFNVQSGFVGSSLWGVR